MPSGRIHTAHSLTIAAATTAAALLCADYSAALGCAAGGLAAVVIQPDLDVDDGCISFSVTRKYFGLFAAWGWRAFWLPYSRIPHRSPWSHWPVLGTAVRVLYLAVPVAAVWWWCGWPAPAWSAWHGWALAVLALCDGAHWALDGGASVGRWRGVSAGKQKRPGW